jgi:hypothetical protein
LKPKFAETKSALLDASIEGQPARRKHWADWKTLIPMLLQMEDVAMRTTLYYAPLSRSKSAFDQISVARYAWRRANKVSGDLPLHDLAKAINHDRRADVAATSHATDDLSITEEPKSSVAFGLDTPENGDGEHLYRGSVAGSSTIRNQFPIKNGLLRRSRQKVCLASMSSELFRKPWSRVGNRRGVRFARKATGPRRQPTKLAA